DGSAYVNRTSKSSTRDPNHRGLQDKDRKDWSITEKRKYGMDADDAYQHLQKIIEHLQEKELLLLKQQRNYNIVLLTLDPHSDFLFVNQVEVPMDDTSVLYWLCGSNANSTFDLAEIQVLSQEDIN
ncbi:hypothetical protein ROZALSC1DRAFT_25831, partial [Rozella allomycis CSF55]